jgi:hypothetical protein
MSLATLGKATQIGSFLCRTAKAAEAGRGRDIFGNMSNIFATKLCQYKQTLQGWSDKCKMQRHNYNTFNDFTYNAFTYNAFTYNDFTNNCFTYEWLYS